VVADEAGGKPLGCQKGRGWPAAWQASLSGEEPTRKRQ
jgi:hypothetical protein